MTTPLLIANSASVEIRNMLNHLKIDHPARYYGFLGKIQSVDTTGLTICDDNFCILILPPQWEDIEVEPIKQYSKMFKSKVDDHPGNDLLPNINLR